MVLGESTALVGMGIVIGLATALAATRVLRALLFDVQPTDPGTFALAGAVLGVVGVAAAFVPARRAARLDPLEIVKEI
jgi:ABC-type antimicrobial peptide transport system permease subunit